MGGRGEQMAEKKLPLKDYLEKLVRTRPNDAVKLAFLSQEDADKIGRLELGLLSEMKRGANGVVEIKLLDKTEILARLAELYMAEDAAKSQGADFYEALHRAAGPLDMPAAGEPGEKG